MFTSFWIHHLIEASIGASVLIALLLLARRFVRVRVGGGAIYAAWLLVALRLLLPLSLPNPLLTKEMPAPAAYPQSETMPILQAATAEASAVAYVAPSTDAAASLRAGNTESSGRPKETSGAVVACGEHPLTQALFITYLAGMLATAGYFAAVNARFYAKVRRARVGALEGKEAASYAALCRTLRVKPLSVWLCDPMPGACLAGVVRPHIALPLTVNREDLHLTLTHELCHAKSLDPLWGFVRNICCVLFWFHPLVWLGAHVSRLDGEIACDERVTRRLTNAERIGYADMLVRMALRRGAPRLGVLATGMSMNGRRMRARVCCIVQSRRVRRGAIAASALLAAAMLTMTFATAEVKRGAEPDDAAVMDAEAWTVVNAEVVDALGYPAAEIRVRSDACEADYPALDGDWAVTATAEHARFEDGTMIYETPGPWTLEVQRTDGERYALTVNAAGEVLRFEYEPAADAAPGEVVRTELVESIFTQRELRFNHWKISPLWHEEDTAASALVRRAAGPDEARTEIFGSVYAEVYADGTRVRKLSMRQAVQGSLLWRVQMEPLRILSMEYFPEGSRSTDYAVLETEEEASASVKAYLENAGWTPDEIDRPIVRTEDGFHYYGESWQGAEDGWYVLYQRPGRHGDNFWRMDMLQDAPLQRTTTGEERDWAAQKAKAFVQENRLNKYSLTIGEITVEDVVQVYPDGEVARVTVHYLSENYDRRDELCIRLNPEAVLMMSISSERIRWDEEEVKQDVVGVVNELARIEEEAPVVEAEEGEREIRVFGGTRPGARDLWTAVYDKETSRVASFWTADAITAADGASMRSLTPREENEVRECARTFGATYRQAVQHVTVLKPARTVDGRELVDVNVFYTDGSADRMTVSVGECAIRAWEKAESTLAADFEENAPYDEEAAKQVMRSYQQASGGACGLANECDATIERVDGRLICRWIDRKTAEVFAYFTMEADTCRPISLHDLRGDADGALQLDETLSESAQELGKEHLLRYYLYGTEVEVVKTQVLGASRRERSARVYSLPLAPESLVETYRQEQVKAAQADACIEVDLQIDCSDGRTYRLSVDARHGGVFACYALPEGE